MKRICLLTTGGTIACKAGKNGLVPKLDGKKLLSLIPEIAGLCQIDCQELLQLDSSNLQPEDWQLMARAVCKVYDRYDGFVITHGTDTMAFSAAALSYMLKNLAKPVVLTGSQLPIEAPATDAKANVLLAVQAAVSDHYGVYLAFADKVIHGTQAKKMYTEKMQAFLSINRPEAGIFNGKRIEWQEKPGKKPRVPFHCQTKLDQRVIVLKIIPGMEPELLTMLIEAGYKGIIIEGYGVGGLPTDACSRSFLPALQKALAAGAVIVCGTQCIYDGVHLDRYEIGIMAEKYGAISGGDMTVEALTAKLMLALGQTDEPAAVHRYLQDNTLGEVE